MKPSVRKERLQPLNEEFRLAASPSPLAVFPSKHDTIAKAFFGVETKRTKKNKKILKDNIRWLYADKIDAGFGLTGDSQTDTIRRAYRRIESSVLFTQVNSKDAPLSEIVPSAPTGKRFVVVEESRLQELTKLEGTLRREKELLGEQCGWALSDMEVNARIPMPAIRLAVHSVCEQQMLKIAKDVVLLKQNWDLFCRQNHYNKQHMYLKDSYVNIAPISQRALKLRLVQSAVETWRLRKDRDTMLFEDDLSYLMGKYQDARIRQRDYERYYILAARYGPYSEKEFNLDPRPGRRYFKAASTGAIKLQLLWDRYWSMAKLRRYRAARMIQKYYRRRFYYKKLHPIIKLRLKIGKKTYYMFCWHQWLHYNYLCRKIKDALNYQFNTFIQINFKAWKKYVKEVVALREGKASRMISRSTNSTAYYKFKQWIRYVKGRRALKVRLRRLFGFPHFDLWVQHVKWVKHMKNVQIMAARVQALFKMAVHRRRFLRKKQAHRTLRDFNRLVMCVRSVRRKRREAVLLEFADWSPGEALRRSNRANEIERQRLIKRQQFVAEKEKGALAGLRKHLNSKDGQRNLDELIKLSATTEKMVARYPAKKYLSMSKEDKCKLVAKSLGEDCSKVIRVLESHNYSTKHPPYIQCADVHCGATCTSEEQYHSHLKESAPHHGNAPQFSGFHVMLRHQRGQELLRSYLTKLHGIAGVVTYLDAYFAIQEFKKLQTINEAYETKALNILELYLLEDSPRRLEVGFPEAPAMLETLKSVKGKDHQGLYRLVKSKPGLVRGLLGLSGQEYYEFTLDSVLPPDVFQHLEWHCFKVMFDAVEKDIRFKSSAEMLTYTELIEIDKERRKEDFIKDYEKYRLMTIQQWTRGFCDHERDLYNKATEIVDIFMKRQVEILYKQIEREEVNLRMKELRHTEQSEYEGTTLLVDDVTYWVEDSALDDLFEHYTVSLINKMLEVPDLRKGLLQYGGFLKAQSRHMHVDISANAGKEDWFKEFYEKARQGEKGAPPVNGSPAAVVIQRRMRGVLGRRRVRKIFMKVYVKLYDSYQDAAYYQNTVTGESSWTRPLMTHHLYPHSNW